MGVGMSGAGKLVVPPPQDVLTPLPPVQSQKQRKLGWGAGRVQVHLENSVEFRLGEGYISCPSSFYIPPPPSRLQRPNKFLELNLSARASFKLGMAAKVDT